MALLVAAGRCEDAASAESREVSFESAGFRLAGTLTVPVGQPRASAILIIPGSGPVDRNGLSTAAPSMPPVYRMWAEQLSNSGFAVLRYDKRFLTYPGIDMRSFDQEAQITDAVSAVTFLRSAPGIDPARIFIFGHSEGGTLAPIVAERAGPIAGVAVVNTVAFPVDELIVAQLQANPTVPRNSVAEVQLLLAKIKDGSFPSGGLLMGVGSGYWSQWINYSRDSLKTLSRLSAPLLLIQCMSDETLPGETLKRNLEALRAVTVQNRRAQLRELDAHDHFGMAPGKREPSPEFMRALLLWLNGNEPAAQQGAPHGRAASGEPASSGR